MGSFDGAETHELVDCYILSRLSEKHGNSIGLYRDDGLSAFDKTPQEIEKIKIFAKFSVIMIWRSQWRPT